MTPEQRAAVEAAVGVMNKHGFPLKVGDYCGMAESIADAITKAVAEDRKNNSREDLHELLAKLTNMEAMQADRDALKLKLGEAVRHLEICHKLAGLYVFSRECETGIDEPPERKASIKAAKSFLAAQKGQQSSPPNLPAPSRA